MAEVESTDEETEKATSVGSDNRNPIPLNRLFGTAPIQEAIIREGRFDRFDIVQLEAAGVRVGLDEQAHRTIRGEETQCGCRVDFARHPRRGRTDGHGNCPNTTITWPRLKQCDGALMHAGDRNTWDHHQSVHTPGPWVLNIVAARNGRRHPPQRGQPDVPFAVCSQCVDDGEYDYEDPGARRNITRAWVPYCKLHSLRLAAAWDADWRDFGGLCPGPCRCIEQANRGWTCASHRIETLAWFSQRASYHINYLRRWHHRRRRRPKRSPYAKRKKNKTTTPDAAKEARERGSCYYDEEKTPKKFPGCPAYRCPRMGWYIADEPRRRIAKCLGCGGLERCTGRVGDLNPIE